MDRWSASRPGRFIPGKEPRTDFIGGCVSLKIGLEFWRRDNLSPLLGFELRIFEPVAIRHNDWNIPHSDVERILNRSVQACVLC
jgi:hypothetical protein